MSSPSSCIRCSIPLALASPGGLCPVCASSADTAAPTVRSPFPLPERDLPTATAGPATPTGTAAPGRDTARTRAPVLPHAPAGYDLLERLGGGGMGDVYLARKHTSERLVAMKFLRYPGSPDAVDRFVIELRALALIDHPNVVRLYDDEFLRSDPFFTMEYMPQGSLARGTALPPAAAVAIARAVAGALAAAHAEHIIHRDLKPSNILLAADGTPKVADFGLAKRLDADLSLTPASGALGTVQYMPPEQVTSRNGEIGPWSDVFGLGATLYHLLCGRPPFTGDSTEEIILKVVSEHPPRLRDIPARLEGIVLKCLEKETGDRYQSMAGLIADLDAYTAGDVKKITAPPLTRWRRAKRWAKRNRRAGTASLVVLAAVAGAFALGAAFKAKPQPRAKTPAELLEDVQRDLRDGKSVTLVGETGPPAFYEWRLMPSQLGKSPQNDDTGTFQSGSTSLLELLSDPGIDRYRVTAELRHILGDRPPPGGAVSTSYVGLYLGHDIQVPDAQWRVNTLYAVRFSDLLPLPLPNAPKQMFAQFGDAMYAQHPDGRLPTLSWRGTGGIEFHPKASGDWPGKWRKVQFEVTPDRLRANWWDEASKQFVVAYELTGDQAAARFVDVQKRVEMYAPKTGVVPRWQPRLPIGIYNDRSTVSFKNVVIEPLP